MQQVVLVTGCSSGFGLLTARRLRTDGHEVFAAFRSLDGPYAELADKLRTEGIDVIALDVTSQQSTDQAMAELLERTQGRLDAVVNNAGRTAHGLTESFTPEQMRELFEVNLFAVQRVLRATLPVLMAKRAGLVVNISSVAGRLPIPSMAIYSASKHAVEALSECYRYELRDAGVDVVIVEPGSYPTNLGKSAMHPEDRERSGRYGGASELPDKVLQGMIASAQSGHAPDPEEVADAVSRIIATPSRERSPRVAVGNTFGVDRLNEGFLEHEKALLAGLGLASLS